MYFYLETSSDILYTIAIVNHVSKTVPVVIFEQVKFQEIESFNMI